jgi:hypothetical protein
MDIELLGFDIRFNCNDYVDIFLTEEFRDNYLLNRNIQWPLSVDTMIWPSYFSFSGYLSGFRTDEMIDVNPLSTRQEALRLWENHNEMKTVFSQRFGQNEKKGVQVAVILLAENPRSTNEYWHAVLDPPMILNDIPKEWQLLGHDVADEYMTSGLSNCGYKEEDRKTLEKKWSQCLNKYGLIRNLDDALRFLQVTDRRVPEHAPFYVYVLYSIKPDEINNQQ